MAGVDIIGRVREALELIRNNLATEVRQKWYVDGTGGNDNYDGTSPASAFATIGAAVTAAAAGDAIHIAQATYDEAVSVPAGLSGLKMYCDPGVRLVNTTPGTVVSWAAPYGYWKGGVIIQPGQVGLLLTGIDFLGDGMLVQDCSIGYDLGANRPRFINCVAENTSQTGFEQTGASGIFYRCTVHGQAASRGFYYSANSADHNIQIDCHTLGCTAAGYELVAGADENLFVDCSQSSLCAGPTDAGANNTFANHKKGSQITAGNSVQDDLAHLNTRQGRILCCLDFWSTPQEEIALDTTPTDIALPDVTVADLPAGATIVRAVAMFKFRMCEETSGGVNKLNGAQEIQVRDDTPSAWIDAINFVDDQFTLAANAREGGDVVIGVIDVSGTVDGNDTYNFQWDEALVDADDLNFNDIQVGLRIWFSI